MLLTAPVRESQRLSAGEPLAMPRDSTGSDIRIA